jgi:hypothetical protein
MKMAIVNLDRNTVVNAEKRFALAEQAANERYDEQMENREWSNLYWHTAFTPEYVALDELVEGATEKLEWLRAQDYTLFLLCSRPEGMREATEAWLGQHQVPYDFLVMKHESFRYTKSITWKAGMVHQLARTFHADEVVYVDAEQGHAEELLRYDRPFTLHCYASLALDPDEPEGPDDEEPF